MNEAWLMGLVHVYAKLRGRNEDWRGDVAEEVDANGGSGASSVLGRFGWPESDWNRLWAVLVRRHTTAREPHVGS